MNGCKWFYALDIIVQPTDSSFDITVWFGGLSKLTVNQFHFSQVDSSEVLDTLKRIRANCTVVVCERYNLVTNVCKTAC